MAGTLGQLRTAHFCAKIRKYGVVPSFWFQRIGPCPASHVNVFSGFTPDVDCPLCGGTGEVYREIDIPPNDVDLTGGKILANVFSSTQHAFPVKIQAGDMRCAFIETEYPFAEGDKIGLSERTEDMSENLVRGSGSSDRLRYWPVFEIIAVYVASGEFNADSYVISTDKRSIQFSGTNGPTDPTDTMAADAQYTVRYRFRPSYIVVQGSFIRRPAATNGELFPTEAVLRRYTQSPMDQKDAEP